jgi:hypothetical protein
MQKELLKEIDSEVAEQVTTLAQRLRTSDYPPDHLREVEDGRARCRAAHQVVKAATEDKAVAGLYNVLGTLTGILWAGAVLRLIILLNSSTDHTGWEYLVGFALAIAVNVVTGIVGRWAEKRREAMTYAPEVLAAVLPLVAFRSPMEAAYAGAVAGVLRRDPSPSRLAELRGLLDSARRLSTRREEVERACGGETPAMIEADCRTFAERAACTGDEEARDTLCRTLALCEERLRRARALEPLRERLDAERDLILQLFASVQSSSACQTLALAPAALFLPPEELGEAVARIDAETRSMERAAEEVARVCAVAAAAAGSR